MGRYFGRIVAWEKPPAGKIWRAFFDDGRKVYFHEDDIAKISEASGGLPSFPLVVETNLLGRVKQWTADSPVGARTVTDESGSSERPGAYSEADWDTLCMAPFWILTAVGLADGAVQDTELDALFRHMTHADVSPSATGTALFGVLARNYEDRQALFFADNRSAEEGLRQTSRLIDRLDPDDAFNLRTQLFVLARDVAAGHGTITYQEKDAVVLVSVLIGLAGPEM